MTQVTDPALYSSALRRREQAERTARAALRAHALETARAAAAVLRAELGADKVVLFGSLAEDEGAWFGPRSDIDLAAWGIDTADYLDAVARMDAFSPDFEVNVVAMERCPPHLRDAIETHGIAV